MSWILYTIAATLLQTFRNLEQKSLNKKLDSLTVSWSRFILPLPFAVITVIYSSSLVDKWFIFCCFITALFQVAGIFFYYKLLSQEILVLGLHSTKQRFCRHRLLGCYFLILRFLYQLLWQFYLLRLA